MGKIPEETLERSRIEREQRNAYSGGDMEKVRVAIVDKNLCPVVQKWIIRDKNIELIELMANVGFKMTSALQRFYRNNATSEMKQVYTL